MHIQSFSCSQSSFNKYGKWNKSFHSNKNTPAILIWEDLVLFENSAEKFIIAATGFESAEYVYSGLFVFDKKGNDMLAGNSFLQEKIKDRIGELIRKNDYTKTEFYEEYWTTFDPKVWEYGSCKWTKFIFPRYRVYKNVR